MAAPTYREAVAAEVRAALARKQMTQVSLAAHIDMSRGVLSDRLAARSPFAVDELYRIADALDVDLWSLVPSTQSKGGAA